MTTTIKEVYLSAKQFKIDLQDCLTIIKKPTKKNQYYICEYISYSLYKSIIHVYINK